MKSYTLPIASDKVLGGIKVGGDFEIGKDGTLEIKDMDTLQKQLSDLIAGVEPGKALIAEAITEKKISTSAGSSFETMADNIRKIQTGVSLNAFMIDLSFEPYTLVEE